MTSRLLALSLLASAMLCAPVPALGQCGGKGGFRDESADDPLSLSAASEPARQEDTDDGPVVAGPPTRSAEIAERLYKMERWGEAAVALRRVARGETDDTTANRQIADYRLAIALYRLESYHASYAILSAIADKPGHLRFRQALPWLATLARGLLHDVRDGRPAVPSVIRPMVESVLSDRRLLRALEYLRGLDAEEQRFRRLPAGVQGSPLGSDVIGAVSLARRIAWHQAAGRIRTVLQRGLDELDEQIRNSHLLLSDIATAKRDRARDPRAPIREDVTYGNMLPDHEHFQWPFDGEYWKDELGSYRQVVVSRCGR